MAEQRPFEHSEGYLGGRNTGIWGAFSWEVFLIGLTVLRYLDWWWSGIPFLIGIMIIISGITSYAHRGR